MDGKHVECGLGSVIGQRFYLVYPGLRVAMQGKGSEHAGHIDDAAGLALAQERQKGLGQFHQTEKVNIKSLAEGLLGNSSGTV